jgi:hypothetical protein
MPIKTPFYQPTGENASETLKKIEESELVEKAENLKPGEKMEIWDDGKSRWFNEPKHTIVKKDDAIEIYDGYSGFLSKPRKVIKVSKDDGCFVATVVYGNPHCAQVETLREIRDNVLKKYTLGRTFIDFYYSGAGKRTAKIIEKHLPSAISPLKNGLDYLINSYRNKAR